MTCQYCSSEADYVRVTTEFSAASATGQQIVDEVPLCAVHYEEEVA